MKNSSGRFLIKIGLGVAATGLRVKGTGLCQKLNILVLYQIMIVML
jgi:hypothetical protein